MPKAANIVRQSLTLREFFAFDKYGNTIPADMVFDKLNLLMDACKYVQNCYLDIKFDDNSITRDIGVHTKAGQRESFIQINALPKTWKSSSVYNRNNIGESCRILKTWQQRYEIAKIVVPNPDITIEELKKKLGLKFINYRWVDNIRRAGRLPAKPFINNVRLITSCDSHIIPQLCPSGIWIRNIHIATETMNLFFPVSKKQYSSWGRIVKPVAPIICLDKDGYYTFDFCFETKRKNPKNQPNHLGVDPKLNNGFAAVVIRENKQISGYVQPSVQTQRCQRKADHISNDIGFKRKKVNNIKACEAPNQDKIDELEYQIYLDQQKRQRVNEALDWQAANDLVNYAEQVKADICYENVNFSLGGKLHFRSTQKRDKVKQVAAKHGVKVTDVDAAYTSQDCPRCGNRDKKALSNRTHHCKKCGLKCDRDYASAINMAKRGGKVDDPRWTEAINSKKQIMRKNTLGSRVGGAGRHTNSGDRKFDEAGCERISLHWRKSARRKKSMTLVVDEYYLVGNVNYKTLSIKQKTSTTRGSGG